MSESTFVVQQSGGLGATGSSIFVRPGGEADVVLIGMDNSLLYFSATPGSPWTSQLVAGPGSISSDPAIFVRADGEADIVAAGPDNSLMYYWAMPGGTWSNAKVGSAFSALSIAVRVDGEADIVAQGPAGPPRAPTSAISTASPRLAGPSRSAASSSTVSVPSPVG
jgi:hypothetical protein